jgi:hypothetical protein
MKVKKMTTITMTITREILARRTHDNDNHYKKNNKNITIVRKTS